MIINTNDLLRIINRLTLYLKEQDIEQVVINDDYYWNIAKSQRTDVYVQPTLFTLGQLTSDWEELTNLLNEDKSPIGYHFVWLAEILRAIGEEVL